MRWAKPRKCARSWSRFSPPKASTLFDCELKPGLLRVTIEGEAGVDAERLAKLSLRLSRLLDEHDPIPGRYTLEVSSPGSSARCARPSTSARDRHRDHRPHHRRGHQGERRRAPRPGRPRERRRRRHRRGGSPHHLRPDRPGPHRFRVGAASPSRARLAIRSPSRRRPPHERHIRVHGGAPADRIRQEHRRLRCCSTRSPTPWSPPTSACPTPPRRPSSPSTPTPARSACTPRSSTRTATSPVSGTTRPTTSAASPRRRPSRSSSSASARSSATRSTRSTRAARATSSPASSSRATTATRCSTWARSRRCCPQAEQVPVRALRARRPAQGVHRRGPQDHQGSADRRQPHPPRPHQAAVRARGARDRQRRRRDQGRRPRARPPHEDRGLVERPQRRPRRRVRRRPRRARPHGHQRAAGREGRHRPVLRGARPSS